MFQVFLFIAYSFWVPQIVSNIRRDASQPLLKSYIAATSLARLLNPAYFFLVDPNFARTEPNPMLIAWLIVWVAAQALLLVAQDFFGPRFFVPQVFLPTQYDYTRLIPASITAAHQSECVVRILRLREAVIFLHSFFGVSATKTSVCYFFV